MTGKRRNFILPLNFDCKPIIRNEMKNSDNSIFENIINLFHDQTDPEIEPNETPGTKPKEKPEIEPEVLPEEEPGIQPGTKPGKQDDDDDDDDPFTETEIGDDPDEIGKKTTIM